VLLSQRGSTDRKDGGYVRIEQAFAQNALAHHAGCAEQNRFHVVAAQS
jgi:hypothetical protein